jgi:hypothetical protein
MGLLRSLCHNLRSVLGILHHMESVHEGTAHQLAQRSEAWLTMGGSSGRHS